MESKAAGNEEIYPGSPTPLIKTDNHNLIINGSFSEHVLGWDVPYGNLVHSTDIYNSNPGAGVIILSDFGGPHGYRANLGQCVDLRNFLKSAGDQGAEITLTMQAAVKMDRSVDELSFRGIFIDDNRCGTGHVGSFEGVILSGTQDWSEISSTAIVPEGARSLHVFFSMGASQETAKVYLDDVLVHSPD